MPEQSFSPPNSAAPPPRARIARLASRLPAPPTLDELAATEAFQARRRLGTLQQHAWQLRSLIRCLGETGVDLASDPEADYSQAVMAVARLAQLLHDELDADAVLGSLGRPR